MWLEKKSLLCVLGLQRCSFVKCSGYSCYNGSMWSGCVRTCNVTKPKIEAYCMRNWDLLYQPLINSHWSVHLPYVTQWETSKWESNSGRSCPCSTQRFVSSLKSLFRGGIWKNFEDYLVSVWVVWGLAEGEIKTLLVAEHLQVSIISLRCNVQVWGGVAWGQCLNIHFVLVSEIMILLRNRFFIYIFFLQ